MEKGTKKIGGSIINILEVCESDFATNLAKEESEEADSAESYEKTTQENKLLGHFVMFLFSFF